MSFSISTQTGEFSYVANITPTQNDDIFFGFGFGPDPTPVPDKDLIFSGISGKLFDKNQFIGSYESGESFKISGNRFYDKHNYFINDELINSNSSLETGNIKFFKKGGVDCSVQLLGEKPDTFISGLFKSAEETGFLVVKNLSTIGTDFNCFSGTFKNINNILNFESGQNTGTVSGLNERLYKIFKNNQEGSGVIPFPLSFETDFGQLNQSGIITFLQEYFYNLSIFGLDDISNTGIFDYDIIFSERFGNVLVPDPYPLNFRLSSESGVGNFADFDTTKTGKWTGVAYGNTIPITTTGNIVGVGNLTGVLGVSNGFNVSGYSTGLQRAFTGLLPTQVFTGATQFATGAQSHNFNIAASGFASGLDTVILRNISGGYNFSETGLIIYTGQAPGFKSITTGFPVTGITTKGVQAIGSDAQQFVINSNNISGVLLDSDQTVEDFSFENTFSGFASGALTEQVFAPLRQGTDDSQPEEFVSDGFKKTIDGLSGFSANAEDPILVTGTGFYNVTGFFETLRLSDFAEEINFVSGFSGLYTGSIPIDTAKTGIGGPQVTGITGAATNQFIPSKFSGIFSGFSTGVYTGIFNNVNSRFTDGSLVPFDQEAFTTTNVISGFSVSGDDLPYSLGSFNATGSGLFNVTGVNLIDVLGTSTNFPMIMNSVGITGVATGILSEDPNFIVSVFTGSGVTGIQEAEGTGVLVGSGIITGLASSIVTGFTGINFNYNFIAENKGSFFSGFTTGGIPGVPGFFNPVTGKNFTLNHVLLSGDYEYRFAAKRPASSTFRKQLTVQGQDQLSGVIDFTGEFTYSGTGAYQHTQDITGVGYTGLGIFGAIVTPTKNITFDGSPTGRKLTNTGRLIVNQVSLDGDAFGIPVSSVYDRYNPFHISGHSGIALICDHTNDTAPIFDFSPNDSSRSSYIHHPVWLRYNRLDSADREDIRCGLSPRYFLSGDRIHKSRNTNTIAITVYTGADVNNLTWKETDADTVNESTTFNSRFIGEDVRTPDNFTEDFYFLITRNGQSSEPSGFYYFYFQDEVNAQTGSSPPQFNTFFDSSSGMTREYLTNYSSATNISGELLSADTVYPTGLTTNLFARSLPGMVSFTSGFNSFATGFRMTGSGDNVAVQGTGMTGVGFVTGSGEVSGELQFIQDRTRFPNLFQTNEIFTQMTGDFDGNKSFNNFEINTGTFASNDVYLLVKRSNNDSQQEVDEYESSNYKQVTRYRIPSRQDSIEEISGDLKNRLEKVGYNVYVDSGSGKLGFTSLPNMTYPVGSAFAFGTSSSSHSVSLTKDRKLVTRQSGGLFTLLENGLEIQSTGNNLPFSGIMSGKFNFKFNSPEATGTGIFQSGVSGNLFQTGFTGLANVTSTINPNTARSVLGEDDARYFGSSSDFIKFSELVSTGVIPTTGLGTGEQVIVIPAGTRFTSFPGVVFDMVPFVGTGMQSIAADEPAGGFLQEYSNGFIFSGVRTGDVFATGNDSTGFLFTTGFTGFGNVDCTANIVSFDFNSNVQFQEQVVTGVFGVTGAGTGLSTLTISAGQSSGFLSDQVLDMLEFTGINGSIDDVLQEEFIGDFNSDYVLSEFPFSGVPTGFAFATGIVTGLFDYSGTFNSSQQGILTTGARIGIGQMTGQATGMILPGSGSFVFSGLQTGEIGIITNIINTGAVVIASSGNVALSPFSGAFSNIFSGTGIYGENLNQDVSSLNFNLPIPNYIQTFTGEYEIATGLDTGSLSGVPVDDVVAFSDTNFTGYSGRVILTGDQDLLIRLTKKKYFDDGRNNNIIFFSGEGTLDTETIQTGNLIFRG